MSLLATVVALLEDAGIPHALIGATALATHGVARATMDLDLLAVGGAALAEPLWESLRAEGDDVDVDIRLGDDDDPLLGVVRVSVGDASPVDLVVGRSAWQRDILARAGALSIEGTRTRVVDAADLILLKLYAGGPQDCWDIERLLKASPEKKLAATVEQRIAALPAECHQLWQSIRTSVSPK